MGIGWTEIVLVLIVALVVLGPARFPAAARRMGKAYREIRDALGTVRDEVERAARDEPEPRPPTDGDGRVEPPSRADDDGAEPDKNSVGR